MILKKSILLLIPAALSLTACNNQKTTEAIRPKVVTATLNGPSAMAMIRMIEAEPLLDSATGTEFIIKNEPNQIRALMFREEIDFAVLPSTMGALLYNTTGKYILAAVPVWGTLYLAGQDSTIKEWSDLKGKKISLMARGMTPDIVFRYLAEKNGLNPEKDIVPDYSLPTHIELSNAIAAGRSELGVLSEPLLSLVMMQNSKVRPLLDFNEEWLKISGQSIPFAQTALLVKKSFANQHPDLVDAYLKLLEESINWANTNQAEAAALIVKHNILPSERLAEESIPRCNLQYSQAWKEMKGIEEYFRVFYEFSPLVVGGKLPDDGFYYREKRR